MQLSCVKLLTMNELDQLLLELKNNGHRITNIRKSLLGILLKDRIPFSICEIMNSLKKKKINFNKTTIYREIDFLKRMNIVNEIQFIEERAKRYEIFLGDHHHHLVCISCKKMEDIKIKDDLNKQELEINKKTGFKVLSHSLEFSGICSKCC